LRQACLDCWLVVELVEHALDDLTNGATDIVLDGNVRLRVSGLDVPSRKTVDRRNELKPEIATLSDPCCCACVTVSSTRRSKLA
jgi:hypothetical protein